MSDRDDSGESRRTVARRAQRLAGELSGKLANDLMKLSDEALDKLELDEELRDDVDRARAITAQKARRRSERELAGALRGHDLADLAARLARVQATGRAEPALFQLAEQWRARLIDEGADAAAELPGGAAEPLPRLIQRAQRERDIGQPRGAARALFRHIHALLKHAPPAAPRDPDRDDD